MDIMIDIETLDTTQHSVILSIGAVRFDPHGGIIGETFYERVDIEDQPGRTIGPNTLKFWLEQDPAMFKDACNGSAPLEAVLLSLKDFINGHDGTGPAERVWANGVMFDLSILENAYGEADISCPWQFWAVSCMRTLKGLVTLPNFLPNTKKHDALSDAVWQASWVMAAIRHMKGNFSE